MIYTASKNIREYSLIVNADVQRIELIIDKMLPARIGSTKFIFNPFLSHYKAYKLTGGFLPFGSIIHLEIKKINYFKTVLHIRIQSMFVFNSLKSGKHQLILEAIKKTFEQFS